MSMPQRTLDSPPRFAADAMLGRLARWLRVLDFDTFYEEAVADDRLVRLADEESRILLTRDRHLLRELRPRHAFELRQDAPLEQLKALVTTLQLAPPADLFMRCMLCNTRLSAPLDEAQVKAVLPAGMTERPSAVRQCPSCGRCYWFGSHTRRMREAIERALPGWLP
jgi:uncharacterized protein